MPEVVPLDQLIGEMRAYAGRLTAGKQKSYGAEIAEHLVPLLEEFCKHLVSHEMAIAQLAEEIQSEDEPWIPAPVAQQLLGTLEALVQALGGAAALPPEIAERVAASIKLIGELVEEPEPDDDGEDEDEDEEEGDHDGSD